MGPFLKTSGPLESRGDDGEAGLRFNHSEMTGRHGDESLLDPRFHHGEVTAGFFRPTLRGKRPIMRSPKVCSVLRKQLSAKVHERGQAFFHHPKSFPSAIKRPLKLRRGNVAQSRISGKAFMGETVAVGFCGLR